MKIIKIKEDHYAVVDDSEIKEGDYYVRTDTNLIFSTLKGSNPHIIEKYCKKITHSTQPLSEECKTCTGYCEKCVDGTKSISLSEVKELIGEVDMEKLFLKIQDDFIDEYDDIFHYYSFVKGYGQSLEDNKEKKYTEAQMRECWRASERFDRPYHEGYAPNFEEFIQSLQPKTEWEVEIVNGKLKLV